MNVMSHGLAASAVFMAQAAIAGDPQNGERLALLHCAPCHIVAPYQRREVADSPSFETIAWKFGSNSELLISAILAPRSRMNMTITRREAKDLAAYIDTLAR